MDSYDTTRVLHAIAFVLCNTEGITFFKTAECEKRNYKLHNPLRLKSLLNQKLILKDWQRSFHLTDTVKCMDDVKYNSL